MNRAGNDVLGMVPYPFGHGTHAEYVIVPARALVPKPEVIDHVQAGALPLVGLTAWQALVEYADVRPGQRVLIHAAAGGVGHGAVQIAKARGAYVIGTASAAKHDFLREIGVDEPVDYRSVDVTEAVRDVDVVLDTLGGDTSVASLRMLRPGGVLVSILPVGSASLYEEADRLACGRCGCWWTPTGRGCGRSPRWPRRESSGPRWRGRSRWPMPPRRTSWAAPAGPRGSWSW